MPAQNTFSPFGPIVRTTDATETTLGYHQLLPSRVYLITAAITALNEDLTQAAGYVVRATYVVNAAGTVTLVGSVTAVYTAESNAAWAATFDIADSKTAAQNGTGPYVRSRVTGAAVTNIVWKADYAIQETVLGSQSSGG